MDYTGKDFYCDVAIPGKIALEKEYESDLVLAYHHTRPHWPVHIVVVPKRHIDSFTTLAKKDTETVIELMRVLQTIAAKVEREHGAARIQTHLGRYQDSKHLHFHTNSGDPVL